MMPRATCEECDIGIGHPHRPGCRFARCMVHGRPAVACTGDPGTCDTAGDVWTGWPPGHRECFDLGWYIRYDPETKEFTRCRPDEPGSGPALCRLYDEAVWDRDLLRWIRRPDARLTVPDVFDFLRRRRADITDPPEGSELPRFFGPEADSGEPGQLIISAQVDPAGPDWWATGGSDGSQLRKVFEGASPYVLMSFLVPSGEAAIGFHPDPESPSAGCRFPADEEGDRRAATALVHITEAVFAGGAPAVRGVCGHWWPQPGDDFAAMRNDCPECDRPPGYRVGAAVGIQPPPPENGEMQ